MAPWHRQIRLIHLPHKVDHIFHHGLKHLHRLPRSGARTADADCEARTEAHVCIKGLRQQGNQSRYLQMVGKDQARVGWASERLMRYQPDIPLSAAAVHVYPCFTFWKLHRLSPSFTGALTVPMHLFGGTLPHVQRTPSVVSLLQQTKKMFHSR